MKKAWLLVLSIGLAVAVNAQTKVISKKPEEKELKTDIKVKREHKKKVFKNLAKLKIKKAGKEQDIVNAKRKEVHTETKELRALGVKHPAHEAKKEIRKEKQATKPNGAR